jgi:short subunit dehydrogenase-like uncharacterized protein
MSRLRYGANGWAAELTARAAVARGLGLEARRRARLAGGVAPGSGHLTSG